MLLAVFTSNRALLAAPRADESCVKCEKSERKDVEESKFVEIRAKKAHHFKLVLNQRKKYNTNIAQAPNRMCWSASRIYNIRVKYHFMWSSEMFSFSIWARSHTHHTNHYDDDDYYSKYYCAMLCDICCRVVLR